MIIFSLFGKRPLNIKIKGITNDPLDGSVDTFIYTALPLLKHFGVDEPIDCKIIKRSFRPKGNGEIHLKCPIIKFLRSCDLTNEGLYKKIRGTAFGQKVSPDILTQMISKTREIFNDYIPDVWVYSDNTKTKKESDSLGYGISLMAESKNGSRITSERVFD